MRKEPLQSESNLGTDSFDAEMVEAALIYHRERVANLARGEVPVEVVAFVAGACWARQVLLGDDKEENENSTKESKS
jgi:hypothetical protein